MADARRSVRSGASAAPATFWSVFAVGEFRVLFGGMILFALGFEFEILGLSVLVYARTGSSAWAAAAFSAGFLPQAVGGAFFTSLADRLPPRLVITAGLLTRAAPGLAIGLLPAMPVLVMLAVVAVAAVVVPVFFAGFSGSLPDVLDGDRYVLGRSLFSIAASATQILGLGIGGAVLAALPARWLLLSAGCALTAAAVVVRLGVRARPARAGRVAAPGGTDAGAASGTVHDGGSAGRVRGGAGRMREVIRATVAGNAELLRIPAVRGLLLAQWLPAWFCTSAEALIVPYTEELGHPVSAASPLLAAVPCGMLLGDVAVGRFCRPAVRRRLAFPLALLVGVPLLALAFRPPLLLAAGALFAAGVGCAYPLGLQQVLLDSLPARLRGQGFGLNSTGLMGGQGLAPSAFGAIAAIFGAPAIIAVAGAASVLAVLGLRRRLLPDDEGRSPTYGSAMSDHPEARIAPVEAYDPPYYVAVFTTVRTQDQNGYSETNARLEDLVNDVRGFLGMDHAQTPGGLGITVGYFRDADALAEWRCNAEHRAAQKRGQAEWYQSYTLHVAKVERSHGFTRG